MPETGGSAMNTPLKKPNNIARIIMEASDDTAIMQKIAIPTMIPPGAMRFSGPVKSDRAVGGYGRMSKRR